MFLNWTKPSSGYAAVLVNAVFSIFFQTSHNFIFFSDFLSQMMFMHITNTLLCSYYCFFHLCHVNLLKKKWTWFKTPCEICLRKRYILFFVEDSEKILNMWFVCGSCYLMCFTFFCFLAWLKLILCIVSIQLIVIYCFFCKAFLLFISLFHFLVLWFVSF